MYPDFVVCIFIFLAVWHIPWVDVTTAQILPHSPTEKVFIHFLKQILGLHQTLLNFPCMENVYKKYMHVYALMLPSVENIQI